MVPLVLGGHFPEQEAETGGVPHAVAGIVKHTGLEIVFFDEFLHLDGHAAEFAVERFHLPDNNAHLSLGFGDVGIVGFELAGGKGEEEEEGNHDAPEEQGEEARDAATDGETISFASRACAEAGKSTPGTGETEGQAGGHEGEKGRGGPGVFEGGDGGGEEEDGRKGEPEGACGGPVRRRGVHGLVVLHPAAR